MCFPRLIWWGLFWAVLQAFPSPAQTLSWSWSNPLPHGNDVVGLAWNGTLGVQVCDSGQIYTSPDLINWTPQNSHLTNDLQAVTFFGHRLIVTGANGAVAWSDDGTNFTAGSLNTTNWIVGVAASSNLVVAVSDYGTVFTSTNGATWQKQSPPPNLTEYDYWLNSVAYGQGVFVTVGDGGYVAVSTNGTVWTDVSPKIMAGDGDLEAVGWSTASGSISHFPYPGFWAVTDNASGESHVFYSTNNGSVWRQVSFDVAPTNTLFTFAADHASALLAGDTEARLGSTNGDNIVAWAEEMGAATNEVPPWTYFASVRQTNGVYELAGADGQLVEGSLANGAHHWNTPYASARDWLWQVTVANGLYVAVGDNTRIMTSGDGAAWAIEEVSEAESVSTSNTVFLCVGGDTNLLLTAGNNGSLAVSPYSLVPLVETNGDGSLSTNDVSTLGLLWYPQPAPAGTTNDLAGLCVFSRHFYLVGDHGTLLSSPNGTNWTKQTSGTTNDLSGITVFTNAVFTNGLLVATGNDGTLLTSTNGANWVTVLSGGTNRLTHTTATTNDLYRAHAFQDRLLVVGEYGTLLASTNGGDWVGMTSGVTNWLNDAVQIGATCYVVGNQGVVLASTNFLTGTNPGTATWPRQNTITTKSLEGVATQNGQLLVVGFEGSILRSQIIPEPVNFLGYGQADGYSVFSVVGTVDQQFTLDSSTNLLHWVTGPELSLPYGDGTLIFYQSLPTNNPTGAQFYRCTLVP